MKNQTGSTLVILLVAISVIGLVSFAGYRVATNDTDSNDSSSVVDTAKDAEDVEVNPSSALTRIKTIEIDRIPYEIDYPDDGRWIYDTGTAVGSARYAVGTRVTEGLLTHIPTEGGNVITDIGYLVDVPEDINDAGVISKITDSLGDVSDLEARNVQYGKIEGTLISYSDSAGLPSGVFTSKTLKGQRAVSIEYSASLDYDLSAFETDVLSSIDMKFGFYYEPLEP